MKKVALFVSLLAALLGTACSKEENSDSNSIEFPQLFYINESPYLVLYPEEPDGCLIKINTLKHPEDINISVNAKEPVFEVSSIDKEGIHLTYTSSASPTYAEKLSPYVYVYQRQKDGGNVRLTAFTLLFWPTPVKTEMIVSRPGIDMTTVTTIGTDLLLDEKGVLHLSPLQTVKPEIRLTDAKGNSRTFGSYYTDYTFTLTSGKDEIYVEEDAPDFYVKVKDNVSSQVSASLKMHLKDRPEWNCSQEIIGHPGLKKLHILLPDGTEIQQGASITLKGEQTLTAKPEPEDACAICCWYAPKDVEGGKYRLQTGTSAKFSISSSSKYGVTVESLAGWDCKYLSKSFTIVK